MDMTLLPMCHRLRFDTAEEIAGYFAEDELLGRPHTYWQEYLEGVAHVAITDVQEAARTYLQPRSMRVLIVGPWARVSPQGDQELSPVEALVGHPRTQLQTRDPSTLEVFPTE